MKKLILIAAAWMVAVGAFAQGQFLFTNRDAASGVDARFFLPTDAAGTSSVGAGYAITLFGGPAGGTLTQIATDTFRATPAAGVGYVLPITVTVPGVVPGGAADIRVAITGPGIAPYSQIFNKTSTGAAFTLGGDTITPPTLPMGTAAIGLTLVPEPTTLALAGLGLGALLMIRRRR